MVTKNAVFMRSVAFRKRLSADLDREERIRQLDIERVLSCRDLDKSNSKMLVVS